ncbi:MAG: ketopantoate reductase family protein [Candidatus Fimenecus sp.]
MHYCIVGAGAVGLSVAAALTEAGFSTDILARGANLDALKMRGIQILRGETAKTVCPVRAFREAEYENKPDVIFVSVKGYSLESILPLLGRISDAHTVIIPLLNIYGTGARLQAALPAPLVTDGCVYIAASRASAGTVARQGDIFKIVFGVRQQSEFRPVLREIAADLKTAGIEPLLSDFVQRDTLKKYAYVSPMAAAGLYFDADAGTFQKAGAPRDTFAALMREIEALAQAMGCPFDIDIVQTNLDILDALAPDASTSMQRDIRAGHQSELDGLVFEPVRLGQKYGVPTPRYAEIAEKFGFKL